MLICLKLFIWSSDHLCTFPAIELLLSRARGIESTLLQEFGTVSAAYKSKIRSFYVNLKDKNNPELRENIISGKLEVERFCTMTSEVSVQNLFYISAFAYSVFYFTRKWRLMNGERWIRKSRKRTFRSLSARWNRKQKPTPLNAAGASRQVSTSCDLPLLTFGREKPATVKHKLGALMSRWLCVPFSALLSCCGSDVYFGDDCILQTFITCVTFSPAIYSTNLLSWIDVPFVIIGMFINPANFCFWLSWFFF